MSPEYSNPFNPVVEVLQSTKEKPLSSDQLKPLLSQMKADLIATGANLEPTPEKLVSLGEKQFRDLDSGRGPGIVAVLGWERGQALLEFCDDRCGNSLGVENIADSRGIGLRQVAADLVQLLVVENPDDKQIDKFVLRTNRRIKKDTERSKCPATAETKKVYESIPRTEDTKPGERLWQKFKSIPYDSVPDLWDFLTSK